MADEKKKPAHERRYGSKEEKKPEHKEEPRREEKPEGGDHADARSAMMKRHEKEMRDLHGQHRDAMRDMHKRQADEASQMMQPQAPGAAPAGGEPEGAPEPQE